MKYPISDQISDFLDIRIRFSVFPIRTEPYPTFYYPTISVFDFLISAHLLVCPGCFVLVLVRDVNDVKNPHSFLKIAKNAKIGGRQSKNMVATDCHLQTRFLVNSIGRFV